MPLYLVRWPCFEVSLVKARNRRELTEILDEVEDPGAANIVEYTGPVYLDLDLSVNVEDRSPGGPQTKPEDLVLSGVDKLIGDLKNGVPFGRIRRASCDTGAEMMNQIFALAFPAVDALMKANRRDEEYDEEPDIDEAALVEALKKDLQPLLQYKWRAAQVERKDTPEAQLQRRLRITVSPDFLLPAQLRARPKRTKKARAPRPKKPR